MSDTETTIHLGEAYDNDLRDAIITVLKKNGWIVIDKSWGVAGSVELEIVKFKSGKDMLVFESETYEGLSVTGPKTVAVDIARQVLQHMETTKTRQPHLGRNPLDNRRVGNEDAND